jgi:hypothetical protein
VGAGADSRRFIASHRANDYSAKASKDAPVVVSIQSIDGLREGGRTATLQR